MSSAATATASERETLSWPTFVDQSLRWAGDAGRWSGKLHHSVHPTTRSRVKSWLTSQEPPRPCSCSPCSTASRDHRRKDRRPLLPLRWRRPRSRPLCPPRRGPPNLRQRSITPRCPPPPPLQYRLPGDSSSPLTRRPPCRICFPAPRRKLL